MVLSFGKKDQGGQEHGQSFHSQDEGCSYQFMRMSGKLFPLADQGYRSRVISFDADFPWFRDAAIGELCNIVNPTDNHLYWPSLDVDLAVESTRNPSAFPLISAVRE